VQKYKFTVRPLPDGGFTIDFQVKILQKPKAEIKTTGFFSEKEKIRRTLKPKRGTVRTLNNKIE